MKAEKKINSEMLSSLREQIKPYLTPKRYLHTLAVEEEAAALSGIFFPEDGETENRLITPDGLILNGM